MVAATADIRQASKLQRMLQPIWLTFARKQAPTFTARVMFTLLTLLLLSSRDVIHVGVTHAPPSMTSREATSAMAREEGGGEREGEREGGWDLLQDENEGGLLRGWAIQVVRRGLQVGGWLGSWGSQRRRIGGWRVVRWLGRWLL